MRRAGVLCAISSLPGDLGIGDFSKHAYEFVDSLQANSFKLWQILPFNPVGYGNSPYQPYSSYAGDEVYIDIENLKHLGLLKGIKLEKVPPTSRADYALAREYKNKYLKIAFDNINNNENLVKEFNEFKTKCEWLEAYAVFITFKKRNDLACWLDWPKADKEWIKHPTKLSLADEVNVEYEKFVQFIFFKQWFALKAYANKQGIELMGDMPIYVGIDSSDVWCNQSSFLLDDDGRPTFIAGVPPDYFSETGQRWGNPLYDWDYLEANDFKFWIERLSWAEKLFDETRIDHFRAFDTYWKIPSSCPTAIEGAWIEAPGYALFDKVYECLPNLKLVAEDLGDLRPEVLELRDHYNLSGMKILQFELDPNENNNNFKEKENTIVYTGTHDNQTLVGWYRGLTSGQQARIRKQLSAYEGTNAVNKILLMGAQSIADLVIYPVQDILHLADEARMNLPGSVGAPNWEFKLVDLKQFKRRLKPFKTMIIETRRG